MNSPEQGSDDAASERPRVGPTIETHVVEDTGPAPSEPVGESIFEKRPELLAGAGFAGGLMVALILKRIAAR